MQVHYHLSNIKKADMTAAAYYHKMKGYADTMASLGHPLTDEEILDYMLVGLGPSTSPSSPLSPPVMSLSSWPASSCISWAWKFTFSATHRLLRFNLQPMLPLDSSLITTVVVTEVLVVDVVSQAMEVVVMAVEAPSQHAKSATSMAMMRCIAASASIMPTSLMRTASVLGTPPPTLRNMWTPIGILTAAPMIISLVNSIV
jgi:hypothetical protein